MTTLAKLVVKLTLDDSQYKKKLKGAKSSADAFSKAADKTAASAKKVADPTQKASGALGKLSNMLSPGKMGIGNLTNSLKGKLSPALSSLANRFPRVAGMAKKIGPAFRGVVGAAGKLGGAVKTAGIAIVGAIGTATAAVAAGAAAIVGGFAAITAGAFALAKAAVPVQGIKAAFIGMTQDVAGGSEAMLGSLQKASAGIITNTELMRQFNQASQLVSKDFAQTLPAAMEHIGKVAQATGQDFNFLLNSYTTAAGRLSPMIADNLSITVDATLANQRYAEEIGKSAEALSKQEQQMAFTNEMLRQLEKNTANLPPVVGSARAVFSSFGTDLRNLKDDIGVNLLPAFTELGLGIRKIWTPALNAVRGFGRGFAGILGGLVQVAKGFVRGLAQSMGIDFNTLAGNAEGWGENIVMQLANGMARAVSAVISVLNQLGQMIAGWLAPGSPPKLLPQIDDWGASAMNEFLEGMTKANVNVLRDLSGQIESFIRADMSGADSTEIAKAVLKAREGLEKALSGGGDLMAAVPTEVRGYAQALMESKRAADAVTQAQQQLNDITQRYEDKLKPLNKELAGIRARRQEIIDNQRKAELQAIISDENAPAMAKELAQMELREMQLERQISATEDERDTAVSAAEEKLTAAQKEQQAAEERLELERQLLQHQIETNNLMAETVEQMDELGGSLGSAAGGAGGLADSFENLSGGIGGAAASIGSTVSELTQNIIDKFKPIADQAETLGQTWGTVFTRMTTRLGEWWTDLKVKFGLAKIQYQLFRARLTILKNEYTERFAEMKTSLNEWWNDVKMKFALIKVRYQLFRADLTRLASKYRDKFDEMKSKTKEFGTKVKEWKDDVVSWWGDVETAAADLQSEITSKFNNMKSPIESVKNLVDNLKSAAQSFRNWLSNHVFSFNFDMSSIPPWGTPDSPLPIHMAWKDFGSFLNSESFSPAMDFSGAMMPAIMTGAFDGRGGGGDGRQEFTFNQNGDIRNGMDERELRAKVVRWIREEARRG